MNDYKLQKYKLNYDQNQDEFKKELYKRKMDHYNESEKNQKQYIRINPYENLLKLQSLFNYSDYKFDIITYNTSNPILVFGYGAISEKSKNLPVIFERRPLNQMMLCLKYIMKEFVIVIDILY